MNLNCVYWWFLFGIIDRFIINYTSTTYTTKNSLTKKNVSKIKKYAVIFKIMDFLIGNCICSDWSLISQNKSNLLLVILFIFCYMKIKSWTCSPSHRENELGYNTKDHQFSSLSIFERRPTFLTHQGSTVCHVVATLSQKLSSAIFCCKVCIQ